MVGLTGTGSVCFDVGLKGSHYDRSNEHSAQIITCLESKKKKKLLKRERVFFMELCKSFIKNVAWLW